MKTRLFICVCILFSLLSCSSSEKEQLETALAFADTNRAELEKVLEYYKNDSLKLKAAIYLIENMPLYYTYKGSDLDSLHIALEQYAVSDSYDKHLEYLKRFPYRNLFKEYDAKVITSEYLIENIEYSFKVWRETPWGKYVSFDNFCEFILPYRIKDEPLTHWKKDFYHRFKPVLDSLYQGTDVVEATSCLSNYATSLHWKYQNELTGPHLSAQLLLELQLGDCTSIADFGCYMLRSVGIPVGIDAYLWSPVSHVAHVWNVVLDTTGYTIPFNFGARKLKRGEQFGYRQGKVYRHTYALQKERLDAVLQNKKFGIALANICLKDVSSLYFPSNEITVDCELIKDRKEEHSVWVAIFNRRGWFPIGEGRYKEGKAIFNDIEEGLIYMTLYAQDGRLKEASFPFKIDKESGCLLYYRPKADSCQMSVTRKWPLQGGIRSYIQRMAYGRFEGANRKDFSDAKVMLQLKNYPRKMFNEVKIKDSSKYRYVRYISADWFPGDIAEVAWYADTLGQTKLQGELMSTLPYKGSRAVSGRSAMDGDPLTFFTSSEKPGWVGLDLNTPKQVGSIRYTPRNDDNFVRVGDKYELFYFSADGWKSLGVKVAEEPKLIYNNVPSHALYWLRDLTRGNEEQVFTYYDNKQIFTEGYWNLLF